MKIMLRQWRGMTIGIAWNQPRTQLKLFLLLVVVFVYISYRIDSGKSKFDRMTFYRLEAGSYARVDVRHFGRTLPQLSWPKYQGYNNRYVNPRLNPVDRFLHERIAFAERKQRHPLVRLRLELNPLERHPWKFEKIIHQTWINNSIPGQTAQWVQKWLQLNPDWTYMFWTDETSREFVRIYFPMLLIAYDSWSIPVQKADMFRYIVLYAMGGVYADLDMEVLRPLNDIREWSSCILSREPDIQTYIMSNFMNCWGNNWTFTCNAFMACRSHHPFLHYLIARTVQNSPAVNKQDCDKDRTILCTGPWMMSFAYAFYRRSVPEVMRRQNKAIDVICPEWKWFLPTFDDSRTELASRKCQSFYFPGTVQREICDYYKEREFINEPFPFSYTTHHWFHSYHHDVNTHRVDITLVTKPKFWTTENRFEFAVCYTDKCLDMED